MSPCLTKPCAYIYLRTTLLTTCANVNNVNNASGRLHLIIFRAIGEFTPDRILSVCA